MCPQMCLTPMYTASMRRHSATVLGTALIAFGKLHDCVECASGPSTHVRPSTQMKPLAGAICNTSLEFQVQLKAARDIDRGIARHREAARGGARQREAE